MPSNPTASLFDAGRKFGIGFHLGYAEMAQEADETGAIRHGWAGGDWIRSFEGRPVSDDVGHSGRRYGPDNGSDSASPTGTGRGW
jgi:hypothetical protein